MMKNDGVLPLKPGKIALYGPGSRMTVKGGSGSGDVHERHSISIEEGLINAGFTFSTLWMDRFSEKYQTDVDCWRRDVERKIKGYGPMINHSRIMRIDRNRRIIKGADQILLHVAYI